MNEHKDEKIKCKERINRHRATSVFVSMQLVWVGDDEWMR